MSPGAAVEYDAGRKVWTAARSLWVEHGGRRFVVPRGFESDLASVPRLFWRVIAPFELGLEAPIAHDWLYRTGGVAGRFTRREADAIFLRDALAAGAPAWKAHAAYRAVRWFGRKAWRDAA